MISRRRMDSFQCTFLRLSPSCHARTSDGEAVSSDAVARNSGPMSDARSSMGSAAFSRGSTSTETFFMPGFRERRTSPNRSRAETRVTPASNTPRWGQAMVWRKVRSVSGGVRTLIS